MCIFQDLTFKLAVDGFELPLTSPFITRKWVSGTLTSPLGPSPWVTGGLSSAKRIHIGFVMPPPTITYNADFESPTTLSEYASLAAFAGSIVLSVAYIYRLSINNF